MRQPTFFVFNSSPTQCNPPLSLQNPLSTYVNSESVDATTTELLRQHHLHPSPQCATSSPQPNNRGSPAPIATPCTHSYGSLFFTPTQKPNLRSVAVKIAPYRPQTARQGTKHAMQQITHKTSYRATKQVLCGYQLHHRYTSPQTIKRNLTMCKTSVKKLRILALLCYICIRNHNSQKYACQVCRKKFPWI